MRTADGSFVEWYSDLAGQPVPLTQLSGPAGAQAASLLRDRLAGLRDLARSLRTNPAQADLAEALLLATGEPDPRNVYVVNGQPVIIGWGQAGNAAPAAAPVAVAAAAPLAARRGWRHWLLLLPAVLLLLALVLLALRSNDIGGLGGLPLPGFAPPVTGDDALKAEEDDLRRQQDELEAELRRRLDACPIPAPPPQTPVQPEAPPAKVEPPPAPEAKPEPSPAAKPPVSPKAESPVPSKPEPSQPKPPTPPVQKPKAQAPEDKPRKQADACPPPRPKWKAPEMVIVLDASGSMAISAGVSEETVASLYRRALMGDREAAMQLKGMINQPGRSRLDIAKQSLHTAVGRMPQDIDVGLETIGECSGVDSFRFFAPSERGRLGELLDSVRPRHGTPLARGIERASNMMDGNAVPGVIIVVSDGDESCGGDPCAMARAIKAKKPNLKINFIDVNSDGSGACIVEPSGGKVFSPKSIEDLPNLIQQASEQPLVPPGCGQ